MALGPSKLLQTPLDGYKKADLEQVLYFSGLWYYSHVRWSLSTMSLGRRRATSQQACHGVKYNRQGLVFVTATPVAKLVIPSNPMSKRLVSGSIQKERLCNP